MKLLWDGKEVDCLSMQVIAEHLGELESVLGAVRDLGMKTTADFTFARHNPITTDAMLGGQVRLERSPNSPKDCFLPASPGYWTGYISHVGYSPPYMAVSITGIEITVAAE